MLTDFTTLMDLASELVGGVVLVANDEFFAPKENLLKRSPPVFREDKYTERGKWMDGWETRRRRTPGHDWCILRLGLPGVLRGALVDTRHFKGNFPPQCSLEACLAEADTSVKQLTSPSHSWVEVLSPSDLQGDTQNLFPIQNGTRFTHLRFNIFPDGGVARLRVYGEAVPDWKQVISTVSEVDLVAAAHGGLVVTASDMFFGSRHNLILPGRAKNMSEGWETRRRRGPGHDWAILKLGATGAVHRVEVDTAHFKGNFPESCSLEACTAEKSCGDDPENDSAPWQELLPRTKLRADALHSFEKELRSIGPVNHVRLNIFPDGGVSRLRIFGRISLEGRQQAGLQWLNTLLEPEAERALLTCCGSTAWARQMARRRPFTGWAQLMQVCDEVWGSLDQTDWREAFSTHPRIGEKLAAQKTSSTARRWSQQEQAGTRRATPELRAALVDANRAYESRFGHIFIVCATGKTTEELLALLKQRLQNGPETELRIAAEEQRRITQLRLQKLLEL